MQGSATYNDMLQRFDELLLLELDSPTIVNEYGSAVEESIDELLDAFVVTRAQAQQLCRPDLTRRTHPSG